MIASEEICFDRLVDIAIMYGFDRYRWRFQAQEISGCGAGVSPGEYYTLPQIYMLGFPIAAGEWKECNWK